MAKITNLASVPGQNLPKLNVNFINGTCTVTPSILGEVDPKSLFSGTFSSGCYFIKEIANSRFSVY